MSKPIKRNISSGVKITNKKSKINMIGNMTIKGKNKRNNKFYLIKRQKNFSHDLKAKINLYIEQQRKHSTKDYKKDYYKNSKCYSCFIKNYIDKNIRHLQFSKERYNKIGKYEKNNTFGNITNNSDKDNINNISTKKNILTTNNSNCNNIHYCTTNLNNSTNITDSYNDFNNDKLSIRKRSLKKRINLPFHPNYKKEDYNSNQFDNKKSLVRNNKSEINIPYNKNNKIKIKREMSSHSLKSNNMNNQQNKQDIIENNTSRESFSDLHKKLNYISSFNIKYIKDNLTLTKNDINDFSESIEMNHFRIVTIIQENKKLLRNNDK
jgi:hypothetical protein